MGKIFSFLKSYRLPIVIALVLMFIELVVELYQPFLLAKIIDDGVIEGNLSVVMKWGGVMLGLSFIAFVSGIINSYYAAHVSQSTGYDLRASLYEKIQSFSFAHLQKFQTSSLVTRLTNDVTQIQNTIFMSLRIMLRAPLLIIGGTIMALLINVKLAIILVLTIPISVLFLIWMMKVGSQLFRRVQKKLDGVNHIMRENLMLMRLVKVFVRSRYEGERFTKSNKDLKDQTVKALRLMEMAMPILLLLMNGAVVAILWFGSFNLQAGHVSVGEVVAIVNYATRITAALSVVSMIVIVFSRARASAERITDVLETKSGQEESSDARHHPIKGSIEFEHVSFEYPNSRVPILTDVSFKVREGETLAILGATGSGKSSLFQLIPKLYDANSGRILFDGIDSTKIKSANLRKKIGYVPQEVMLFSGSIRENIAWGKEDATIEEIMEACRAAQIHDTINKLPNQYETRIGQKGVNLSGGQKQRISIARALIRRPTILLLDDSTSALDVKTEARFLEALKQYSCTTLMVTQKISTAMSADSILLLEDGQVTEKGTHEQLLERSSMYQQIVKSQLRKEQVEC